MGPKMPAPLPACLVLILGALLLHGAAAENKCDPSSANCAGVLEAGHRVSTAAVGPGDVKTQYGGAPYDDGAYQDYDVYKWLGHGGLEGAKVYGELLFKTLASSKGAANYFAADEGYVPEGYGNSHEDPVAVIHTHGPMKEFAYEGTSNLFTLDLDATGHIVLYNRVKSNGKNNPMTIVLKSHAFKGYTAIVEVSNTFKHHVVATVDDDTVVLAVPEIGDLHKEDTQAVVFKLSACNATAEIAGGLPHCCIDGQYQKHGVVCRQGVGACDVEEVCSGKSGVCPYDAHKPAGHPCRPAKSFCDLPDTCNDVGQCIDNHKDDGEHCPWSKDCEGCILGSTTLKYSRTHTNPYGGSYNKDGSPATQWPVCVGHCKSGSCEMAPTGPICCREDEDALPEEYESPEGLYESDKIDPDYYPLAVKISKSIRVAARPAATYDGRHLRRSQRKWTRSSSKHGRDSRHRTKYDDDVDDEDDKEYDMPSDYFAVISDPDPSSNKYDELKKYTKEAEKKVSNSHPGKYDRFEEYSEYKKSTKDKDKGDDYKHGSHNKDEYKIKVIKDDDDYKHGSHSHDEYKTKEEDHKHKSSDYYKSKDKDSKSHKDYEDDADYQEYKEFKEWKEWKEWKAKKEHREKYEKEDSYKDSDSKYHQKHADKDGSRKDSSYGDDVTDKHKYDKKPDYDADDKHSSGDRYDGGKDNGPGYSTGPETEEPGYGKGPGIEGPGYGKGPGVEGPGYGKGPGVEGPGYGKGPGVEGPGYGKGPGVDGPGYGKGPGVDGPGYGKGPGIDGPGYMAPGKPVGGEPGYSNSPGNQEPGYSKGPGDSYGVDVDMPLSCWN